MSKCSTLTYNLFLGICRFCSNVIVADQTPRAVWFWVVDCGWIAERFPQIKENPKAKMISVERVYMKIILKWNIPSQNLDNNK